MKNRTSLLLLLVPCFFLSACDDSSEPVASEPKSGHVWKAQTDTIGEAQATADALSESLKMRDDKAQAIRQ